MLKNTRDELKAQLAKASPYSWSIEGWQIANDFVNPQFTLDNHVTYEYQNAAQEICKKQLALAGYRLSNLLIDIFYKASESQEQDTVS